MNQLLFKQFARTHYL